MTQLFNAKMVKSEDVLTEKRLMVHWMNRQDPTIGNMRSKALQATIAWITEAVKQSRPIQPWKTKLPNESRQHQQQKMRKRLQIKNTDAKIFVFHIHLWAIQTKLGDIIEA